MAAPPSIASTMRLSAGLRPAETKNSEFPREGQMTKLCGIIAAGAWRWQVRATPAAAKLNSCDGPIVLGTTISVTGINASLAGRWDKMTDMFEREFNKTGGVFRQLMQ